jgi:hypothetical protein
MLCCFFWLGIPALIFSLKAREQYRSGRYQDAQGNARTSRTLNIIGIVIGSIAVVLSILLVIVFVVIVAAV